MCWIAVYKPFLRKKSVTKRNKDKKEEKIRWINGYGE
jgi:hypothetical protein